MEMVGEINIGLSIEITVTSYIFLSYITVFLEICTSSVGSQKYLWILLSSEWHKSTYA